MSNLTKTVEWLTSHSGLATWGTLLVGFAMFLVALKTYLKKYPFKKIPNRASTLSRRVKDALARLASFVRTVLLKKTKTGGGQKWEKVWSRKGDSSKSLACLDATPSLGGHSRTFGFKKISFAGQQYFSPAF